MTSAAHDPLPVEAARARVLGALAPLAAEDVDSVAAAGRIVAETMRARRAVPAFDNSAMDGVGVRSVDVAHASAAAPVPLRVVGTSLAGGATVERALVAGETVRVMTGAPIPPGVDAIVMREQTDEARVSDADGGIIAVREAARAGQHIRRRGEDVADDDVVAAAGDELTPARLNLLLSTGHVRARVVRRPLVGVLASGDELKEIGAPLGERDVANSNTHAIAAAVRALGCDVRLLGIAADSLDDHAAKMRAAVAMNVDALVTIGGVSMGTHDFVRPALAALGGTLEAWRVAMRPGKPFAFGTLPRPAGGVVAVFGLPGNPVSAQVSFELFLRPALQRLRGARAIERPLWPAVLAGAFAKKPGLEHWARAVAFLDGGVLRVRLLEGQGSHHISALARANALVRIPAEAAHVDEGAAVAALLLGDPHDRSKPASAG